MFLDNEAGAFAFHDSLMQRKPELALWAPGGWIRRGMVPAEVLGAPSYSSGFISPSMVGISSDTVGWMCMVRCRRV